MSKIVTVLIVGFIFFFMSRSCFSNTVKVSEVLQKNFKNQIIVIEGDKIVVDDTEINKIIKSNVTVKEKIIDISKICDSEKIIL